MSVHVYVSEPELYLEKSRILHGSPPICGDRQYIIINPSTYMCVCVLTVPYMYLPSAAGIVTTNGEHYFSVNSTEERDEWIETLRQSSVCVYIYDYMYVCHIHVQ